MSQLMRNAWNLLVSLGGGHGNEAFCWRFTDKINIHNHFLGRDVQQAAWVRGFLCSKQLLLFVFRRVTY